MSHARSITKDEAQLLLSKWHEEQTSLYMVLSVGDPPTSSRLNMPALVTDWQPGLVISHADGHARGYLKCPWSDIEAFEYLEMRDDAEKLTALPGAPEFMRNRSVLLLSAKGHLLIRLVDLTVTF